MPLLNQKDARKDIRLYKLTKAIGEKEFSASVNSQAETGLGKFIDYSKKAISREELSTDITEKVSNKENDTENETDVEEKIEDEITQNEPIESLVADSDATSVEEKTKEPNLEADLRKFLANFDDCVDNVNTQVQQFFANLNNKITDLSLHLAEKLARHSMDKNYHTILENVISKNSNILRSIKTEVFIFVNDKHYDTLSTNMLRDGYDPKYVLKTSSNLEVGDIRIEWQNGCIESMFVNIINDVLKVLDETKKQ